jgi:hypothetical protein
MHTEQTIFLFLPERGRDTQKHARLPGACLGDSREVLEERSSGRAEFWKSGGAFECRASDGSCGGWNLSSTSFPKDLS